MFAEYLRIAIIGFICLYCCIRLLNPIKASDGTKSWSLTLMIVTSMVCFSVVVLDTINDTHSVSTPQQKNAIPQKKSRAKRNTPKPSVAREVIKEKYFTLFALFSVFALLYLLGHNNYKMTMMGTRIITAIRGKFDPLPEEDKVLDLLISEIDKNPGSDKHMNWAVRVLLARQGKEASLPTQEDYEYGDN
jgi:hypothetical protein